MKLKKSIMFIMLSSILLFSGCQKTEIAETESITAPTVTGELNISLLKIGQADSFILQTGNHTAIIDCGEEDDGGEILEQLEKNGITKVDYLFITHFDKDHVGGAAEVISNIETEHIITPDYQGTADEYLSYLSAVQSIGASPLAITEKQVYTLDDVLFEVYPPQLKAYKESDNDFSLVIDITHGENNFLFTGDAESERIKEIVPIISHEYEFLKVPHHGKHNKNTESLFKAVNPRHSVITDSDKNPAEPKTVKLLESCGSEIYYTKDGNISITSNGTELSISQ